MGAGEDGGVQGEDLAGAGAQGEGGGAEAVAGRDAGGG